MQMPGMSGLELSRALQEDPEIPPLKLLLLSSVYLENEKEILAAGISDCVRKPFRRSQLYNSILNLATEFRTDPPGPQASKDSSSAFAGAKILVAEDNPVNQELAAAMLRSLGCGVEIVENGHQVLESIARESYDLILMDCQMPDMDGYETTRRIRSRPSADHQVPIVALTAHALDEDRQKCVEAGMDDYLSKPFSQQQLASAIGPWLKNAEEQSEKIIETQEEDETDGSDQEFIDLKALHQIRLLDRDGSAGILNKVLQIYLQDSSKLVARVEEAVREKKPEDLKTLAHTLKSSSAQVGALKLSDLCRELEFLGRKDSTAGAEEVLAMLRKEYSGVHKTLQQQLQTR
jgi:CheY-like chemotaxis protein